MPQEPAKPVEAQVAVAWALYPDGAQVGSRAAQPPSRARGLLTPPSTVVCYWGGGRRSKAAATRWSSRSRAAWSPGQTPSRTNRPRVEKQLGGNGKPFPAVPILIVVLVILGAGSGTVFARRGSCAVSFRCSRAASARWRGAHQPAQRKGIPTRWVGEQHVREDLGRIPSFAD
jgi:hypothetical protein